jgi:AAA+ ATPase superfamily predicted ATPase
MLIVEAAMFIDRVAELAFLTNILTRKHPGPGQLVMLYGRRRVGKTALLRYWAEQSGAPFTYWVAAREPAALQRRKLFTELLRDTATSLPAPNFESWSDFWDAVAALIRDRRHVLILDELPYAAESDPAMLSSLQHAWDRHFQQSQLVIVICGSHVRTMELLFGRQSPLFGRMTGQWRLLPLPFGTLREFLPGWSPEELVATYAIVGGVPAYLAWLNPEQTLVDNIKHVMLAPGSLVLAEAMFLLQDEVREPPGKNWGANGYWPSARLAYSGLCPRRSAAIGVAPSRSTSSRSTGRPTTSCLVNVSGELVPSIVPPYTS